MGQTAIQLVGAPPAARKLIWLTGWYFPLLTARLAEVPTTQPTIYYFSESGSDTNVGSQAAPFKTMAKLQSVHDAIVGSDAKTMFLFKRGGVREEATNIIISKDNIIIGDWSDAGSVNLALPRFSYFLLKYNSAGWTLASGNRYTRAETSTVRALRNQVNHFSPVLIEATSSAECESTSNSFFWGANVLHINLGGTNPNTLNLEACADNSNPAFLVGNADKVRIRNIRVDGFGCSATAGSYGIKVQNSGPGGVLKTTVVENCEVFYSGNHCFGHNEGASGVSGGSCVFLYCRAGLGYNGGSGTCFVSHNGNGGQETIWHCCEATYGALPQISRGYNATTLPRKGTAIFGHSGGGTFKVGLAVVFGLQVYNNPFGCEVGARLNGDNIPDASTLEEVRVFVNEEMVGNQPCGVLNLGVKNHAFLNCNWHVQVMSGISNQIPQDSTCTGWLINCSLTLEKSNVVWNQGASGPHFFRWWHGLVRVIQPVAGVSSMMTISAAQQSGATAAPSFVNSVLAMDPIGGITTRIDTRNNSANLSGNAYAGILGYTTSGSSQGYDADTVAVQLGDPPSLFLIPDATSSLFRTGAAIPGGYEVEYDAHWLPRLNTSAPTIGPLGEKYVTATPTLGLTVTAGIPGKENNLTMWKGEDALATVAMSPVTSIAGWTVSFTMKRRRGDVTTVLSKTIGAGVVVTNATSGIFTITLVAADTTPSDITGDYYYEINRIDGGSATVLAYGILSVRQGVRV